MAFADILILIVLAASVLGGLSQGFLRAVCGFAGLVLGLVFASWNYGRVAALLLPIVRFVPVADLFGFLLIIVLVTSLAGLIGNLLAKTARAAGLGCVDRLVGGFLGFLQGAFVVSLLIMSTLAFFPGARWITNARLPRHFLFLSHVGVHISPGQLADKIRFSLDTLHQHSSTDLPPKEGKF